MVKITKSVEFNLSNDSSEITLPHLMKEGHIRQHITILFKALGDLGYGEFIEGTRGRGSCHRFVKNDKCPATYLLQIDEKPRGRPRKDSKVESIIVQDVPTETSNENDIETAVMDAINSDGVSIEDIAAAVENITEDNIINATTTNDVVIDATSDVVITNDVVISEDIVATNDIQIDAANRDKPAPEKKRAPQKTKKEKKQEKTQKKQEAKRNKKHVDTTTDVVETSPAV